MRRHLLSAIRTTRDRASYLARWQAVRDAVTERGGHAWVFASADDDSRFIEFIEWKQAEERPLLIDDDVVRSVRTNLNDCGHAVEQLWKEPEYP